MWAVAHDTEPGSRIRIRNRPSRRKNPESGSKTQGNIGSGSYQINLPWQLLIKYWKKIPILEMFLDLNPDPFYKIHVFNSKDSNCTIPVQFWDCRINQYSKLLQSQFRMIVLAVVTFIRNNTKNAPFH